MAFTRISLLYNPKAGGLRNSIDNVNRLVTALARQGIKLSEAQVCATVSCEDATRLAREAVAEQADLLIVCGGDGTINEAAQALVGSNTALAILPSGTANVLAKELTLPRSPEELARLIVQGRTREISVGRASKPDGHWSRYFILMAGIGLDASIIAAVNPEQKKQWGIGSYIAAGLKTLTQWRLHPFSLNVNEKKYEATFAIVANAANYAAWFTIAPNSQMEDEHLDICIFKSHSRLMYLGYAFLSLFGAHTLSPDVIYKPITETYANTSNTTPVQLDGELVGSLPMRFECVPHALRIVA
ncbi:MAG TPA: diacylglycerol kinase family protein [Blastocatellia bacterium]|nr:diacylglycerol kinase family protein [Blastocatellia bacterium]